MSGQRDRWTCIDKAMGIQRMESSQMRTQDVSKRRVNKRAPSGTYEQPHGMVCGRTYLKTGRLVHKEVERQAKKQTST